jgi:S-formylglutathione hydrolase FrmB
MPTRRAFLAGAAVLAAVGIGVGVEEPAIRRRIDAALAPDPARPSASAGPASAGVLASRAVGPAATWRVARPPGAAPGARLPVALVLHGRGGTAASAFRDLWFDRYLAAVVADGAPPFALASVDGGDHSYWHRRRDGTDAQSMLTDEFLPLLATHGLATERFGLFGLSMGGYGALLLAETMCRDRLAAVAADSPALWRRFADSAPGAFDDTADFAAHDVFAGREKLTGIPVRIACGESDPFYPAVRQFVPGVPELAGTDFRAGGHTAALWRSTATGQLRFLADALDGA